MNQNKNQQFDFGLPYVSNYFNESLDTTLVDLETMMTTISARYDEVNSILSTASEETVASTSDRWPTLEYIMSDLPELGTLVASVIKGYKELADTINTMKSKQSGEQLAAELHQQMDTQIPKLNLLFGEVNSYTFFLYDVLGQEKYVLQASPEEKPEGEIETVALQRNYKGLMEKRIEINKSIRERTQFVSYMIERLRKDLAILQVRDIGDDVAERKAMLQQYKTESMIEDVHDYDDLEGQYRHQYDEEGNVIENAELSEEDFQEYQAGRVGYWLVGLVLVGVIVAVITYYFK